MPLRRRPTRKIPPIVQILKDRIEDWGITSNVLFIKPREATFDELIFRSLPIRFTGERYKREFVCYAEVVVEEDMNEDQCDLYRKLKGLECELKWEGLFIKRPRFDFPDNIETIKKYIPPLKPDNTLVDALNSEEYLLKTVREEKIDELTIGLFSGIRKEQIAFADSGTWSHIADYYAHPKKIQWIFHLMKGMYHIDLQKHCQRTINHIFDVLNEVSDITKKITDTFI